MKQKKYILLLFLLCGISSFAQNTWDKRESVGGSKRERGIAFAIGNRGYVGLGQDTLNQMLNDFWEYDPGTNSWTQKANFTGSARRDAAAFAIGTKGYVGTGINNADAFMGTTLTDFWEYSPATNTWTSKANYPGNFGTGIYYASGFAVSGKGYICCGKEGPSNYSNELWEYAPTTNTWLQKSSFPGGVRYGGVAFVIGTLAYFGTGTDENIFNQDFYKYNPTTNVWTPIANFPGSGRFSCSSFTLNNQGYIVFGSDGGYKDELWMYDPPSNYWTNKAAYPDGARRSAIAMTIGSRAYAGTGKGLTGTRRDFYEYTAAPIIGIEEQEKMISTIYPNPITDRAEIILSEKAFSAYPELYYEIRDMRGSLIERKKIDAMQFSIYKNNMRPSIYFLNIVNNEKMIAAKKISIQ